MRVHKLECDCIITAAELLLLKVNSNSQGSAMLMLTFKDVADFAAHVISHRSDFPTRSRISASLGNPGNVGESECHSEENTVLQSRSTYKNKSPDISTTR